MVFKTALGVLSGLVALPVVLAWAVPPLLDGDSLSPLLQDELSAVLGHPVRIGGNTVIRLLPSPSLTADSLDIFDPGEEHQAISSATVQKARVEFPLLPLLRGQLDVSTLQLDNLNLRGVPTITRLTAQRGVTGDIQGALDIAGLSLDFSARFTPGNQITLTDSHGAVLNFNGSISEHGVELAGPVELTMPTPDRSLARFGGFLPTQPLKISAQVTVDQGQVEITNLAGLLGDAAIIGSVELASGHDLTVRMSTNGLDMDRWTLVVPPDDSAAASTESAGPPRLTVSMPLPVLPRVQMALVNESFTLGGLVWPAARLLLETADEQVTLKLAEVDIPGGRIQLSGQGALNGETYFDGTLVLSTRDRQILGAWLGRQAVDFSMTVPINWGRQGVNLTPMTGQWNNTNLYGGLTLIPQENGQVLVVDIKTPQGDLGLHSTVTFGSDKIMNFSDFSAQIGSFAVQGAVQAGWDTGRPRFAAMLTSSSQSIPTSATTQGTEKKPPSSTHGDEPDMVGLLGLITAASEFPIGDSTIDWQGGRLPLVGGLWLDQPRLRMVWQDDGIVLDSLKGHLAGGTMAVKGAILRDPAAKEGRRLEVYAHLTEGDLSALDLPVGPVILAGGRFEVEGNLSTEGRTATAWLTGLGGSLRFDAQKGHLRGLNLPSLVASVRASGLGGLLRLNRKTLLSGVTPFRSLTATAIIDGGLANIDDFDLQMENGQVTAQSHLNWSKGSAETDVTLILDGLMPVQFRLDGPLTNPKVTADTSFKIQKPTP